MKNDVGSYFIENLENGDLKIDYKRTTKDIFYIVVYFIIAAPILFFDYKLISYLINEKIDTNAIIGYFFSACILLFGLYFLVVSFETFIKPTKNAFFINATEKQLNVKLNLFKKFKFKFTEIIQFNLAAKDITVTDYHKGRTYKRPLYLIHMNVELIDGKSVKIHQFEGASLLISGSEKKKNKSLKEVSKQIAELISKECNKGFYWKGTKKE